MSIKVGDRVRSKRGAFTKVYGTVVSIRPESWVTGKDGERRKYQETAAAVYVGKYYSPLVPVSDLEIAG